MARGKTQELVQPGEGVKRSGTEKIASDKVSEQEEAKESLRGNTNASLIEENPELASYLDIQRQNTQKTYFEESKHSYRESDATLNVLISYNV